MPTVTLRPITPADIAACINNQWTSDVDLFAWWLFSERNFETKRAVRKLVTWEDPFLRKEGLPVCCMNGEVQRRGVELCRTYYVSL